MDDSDKVEVSNPAAESGEYKYKHFPALPKEMVNLSCDSLEDLVQRCIVGGRDPARYAFVKKVRDYEAFRVVSSNELAGLQPVGSDTLEGITKHETAEVLITPQFSADRRHCIHETLHRAQKLALRALGLKPQRRIIL